MTTKGECLDFKGVLRLNERLSKAIERGRTIQLSGQELELLVAVGAYEKVAIASAAFLKTISEERLKARIKQADPVNSATNSQRVIDRARNSQRPFKRL